ncbi:hypothetical protein JXB27_04100 [Candidatus Woesearchaeota archaeon]|nr:hypothetical protein [Candidatus Woesearchaeota archaeon]
MAETVELDGSVIKFEGVFDWNETYLAIVSWFRSRRFDYFETKNVKKSTTYGFELEYGAKGVREETDYIRYTIKLALHGYHMDNVEIIDKSGEKKQLVKAGYIEIKINPTIDLDWKHKWEGTEFKKKARTFVHEHMIKRKVDEWKDKIYYEAYQLQTKIKEAMNLEHKYSAYDARKKVIGK